MTVIAPSLPTVSVHLLTFNSEKFVREAINSVLQQDFESLQIVISDDASTDGTVAIIREFEANYPGIFVVNINPTNLGITRNANVALALCTGEFVAFHAGDDVMLPTKLHSQVAYFRANPECVICYHNLDIFDSESGISIGKYNNFMRPGYVGSAKMLIKHGCFIGGPSAMVRRNSIPVCGFNENFKVASDWQFLIAISLSGGRIGYINQALTRYRRHGNNVTINNKQAILDALNTSNWVVVNHPEYISDALKSYAIHLRMMRRFGEKSNYPRALLASIRIAPTIQAIGALAIYLLTLGKITV